MNRELRKRLSKIKLVILDVDGVLTDGGLYYFDSGEKAKKFNVKDGTGIKLLQKAGLEVAFITGLKSKIVKDRAADLGVSELVQGCFEKDKAAEELLQRKGLTWAEVAFIGDDLIDLNLLTRVGFAFAVNDAVEQVRLAADYVTNLKGGFGAVREMCDLIIKAHPEIGHEFWK